MKNINKIYFKNLKHRGIQAFFISGLLMLSALFTNCSKLLEETPPARYQVSKLNKDILEAFVVGAYEPLSRSRGRLWESTLTRNIEGMSEWTVLVAGSLTNYTTYNFAALNNDAAASWITFYDAIGKSNLLIKAIEDDKDLSETVKNPYKAEAYFVRATCYWWLSRLWGSVPMRLKPIENSNDTALPLSDPAAIQAQIIKDLQFAEVNLPAKVPEAKSGRATQAAAKVMLAEIYLTQKDYTKARALAKEVMDKKATYGLDLVKSLETLYSPTAATNSEEIFAVKFSQQKALGSFLPTYAYEVRALDAGLAARGVLFLSVKNVPSILKWDKKDLRRSWNLMDSLTIKGARVKATVLPGGDYLFGKYRDGGAPEETAAGNDFYLYRYADALLIFAEAENQLNGPSTEAYNAVNQVRRRGYGVDINTTNATVDLPTGLTKQAFDDLLFDERGYEFIFECKRWFDMVRTGRAAAVATAAGRPAPTRFTWYIPDVELQNNPLAK
jgi:starch-binding outer membrane protein, SusD/RagB family